MEQAQEGQTYLWRVCGQAADTLLLKYIGKVNFAQYETLLKLAHVQLVAERRSKRRQLRAVNECREALPSR